MFADIAGEYRDAPLGDQRRSARLERIGRQLALDPTRSFPDAMASEGQLEALYRFLNNDEVSFKWILEAHARRTAERCIEHGEALVLHDTTAMEFRGEREGLGRLQTAARSGFFLHVGLAVTSAREPLGVLAAETWARSGRPKGRTNKRDTRKDPNRESLPWTRGVLAAEAALDNVRGAVHVMDREGDNYDLFSQLQANAIRHVVRLAHNRNLVGTDEKLKDVALRGRCVFRREVPVARRPKGWAIDRKRINPERDARTASLAVSGVAVELRRSNNHVPGVPPSLRVNVVTVRETGCPPGIEPIAWFLVTTEPIKTRAQLEFIVDAYRARWVVEEFFKALKSGCEFERRQLESFRSLDNALAIFLPIAVRLLALRGAVRAAPSDDCRILTAQQLEILRRHTTRFMSRVPSNEEAAMALAELGGHLRSNGPPGWAILGRAFERLLLIELGWNQRSEATDD
jgi:hypothetical protein